MNPSIKKKKEMPFAGITQPIVGVPSLPPSGCEGHAGANAICGAISNSGGGGMQGMDVGPASGGLGSLPGGSPV